jgi:hypothetical protein
MPVPHAIYQNPNSSLAVARQLSPAADKLSHLLWPASCHKLHRSKQSAFSFNHLVGNSEDAGRNLETERLGGPEIDDELKLA